MEKTGGGVVLSNALVEATIDERGLIVSLFDRRNCRELIPSGSVANLLQVHRDIPNEWDAWDVDEHYRRNRTDLVDPAGVVSMTQTDAAVSVTRRYRSSTITQVLSLEPDSPVLSIRTTVDWREQQKLLKLSHSFDLRAEHTSSGSQFGHVRRPLHTNTSWEAAKFEFPVHRWLHLDEGGYGVAVTNGVSFGHDASRESRKDGGTTTTVRQTLLRAPLYPDPTADVGHHEFRSDIVVGASLEDAVLAGYRGDPSSGRVFMADTQELRPLVSASGSIAVETVKLADDGSGDLILRLYEYAGRRSAAQLEFDFPVADLWVTDLLERPWVSERAAVLTFSAEARAASLTVRPLQLVTLRARRS